MDFNNLGLCKLCVHNFFLVCRIFYTFISVGCFHFFHPDCMSHLFFFSETSNGYRIGIGNFHISSKFTNCTVFFLLCNFRWEEPTECDCEKACHCCRRKGRHRAWPHVSVSVINTVTVVYCVLHRADFTVFTLWTWQVPCYSHYGLPTFK